MAIRAISKRSPLGWPGSELAAGALGQLRSRMQLSTATASASAPASTATSASAFTSIPVIDIEPLLSVTRDNSQQLANSNGSLPVVKEIDDACRNVGFFYVKGHGVPLDLLDGVREVSREFFNLPLADKTQIGINNACGFRGYQKIKENVTKGHPDLHEAIDLYRDWNGRFPASMSGHPLAALNPWPSRPHSFQPIVQQYVQMMIDLGNTIMKGIGLALNGSAETFEGSRAGDPFWYLRMIGYPAIKDMDQKVEDFGCGEHTDYGLLTLVNQDPHVRALQVRNQAGDWIWVDPIPGVFVVNIGAMLEIWSNGAYQSTLHRVRNSNSNYRVSVPFFYEPNFEAVVEPLETCKASLGGSSKYGPVKYVDHLTDKLLTNFA